jgi:hypothetical protein
MGRYTDPREENQRCVTARSGSASRDRTTQPTQPGIPPLVTEAAEWLVARGTFVDVLTALLNYPSAVSSQGARKCLASIRSS